MGVSTGRQAASSISGWGNKAGPVAGFRPHHCACMALWSGMKTLGLMEISALTGLGSLLAARSVLLWACGCSTQCFAIPSTTTTKKKRLFKGAETLKTCYCDSWKSQEFVVTQGLVVSYRVGRRRGRKGLTQQMLEPSKGLALLPRCSTLFSSLNVLTIVVLHCVICKKHACY